MNEPRPEPEAAASGLRPPAPPTPPPPATLSAPAEPKSTAPAARPLDGDLSGAAAYVAATHAREAEAVARQGTAAGTAPAGNLSPAVAAGTSAASYPPDPAASAAASPPPAAPPQFLSLEQLARVPAHARDGDGPSLDPLHQAIIDAMRSVYDPEIPVNIYDIGLIYDVAIDAEKRVRITMTLTSPTCPAAESLPPEVQAKVAGVDGVTQVDIDLVWEPGWTPVMMSEDARLILNVM